MISVNKKKMQELPPPPVQPLLPAPHQARLRLRWIIAALFILALGWWLWPTAKTPQGGAGMRGQTPLVSLAKAARMDIPVYLDGLGTIQAYNTVTLHPQVDGQLMSVNFTEGQDVKAGDVLAQIDPRTYQAAVDQAVAQKGRDQAALDNAKTDLNRYLSIGNAISGQTVDTQRANVKQAAATVAADQAAIDSARTQLDYTRITAPINGRTGLRQVDVGNIVHPGDANGIVVLTQLQPISVLFSLPQQNLPEINKELATQQQLKVLAVDADNKVLDSGTLALVDNQIDAATGTIRLKATLPNDSRSLWPGGFVNTRLLLRTLPQALYVPAGAIQRGPDKTYVFLFNPADHTVTMRPVTVALTEDQIAVISDGLNEGDQVVTDGAGKLQDGAKVMLPGEAPAAGGKDQKRDKDQTEATAKRFGKDQSREKPQGHQGPQGGQ